MAAIDFPASPTVGQIFVAGNGVSYQWNGTIWIPIGATQALYVGDTPPVPAGLNQLWWNSTSGQLYLWYNDGNSTQWVPAMPILPVGVPAPVTWRQIGRVVPTAGQPTVDFTNIPADINDLFVDFDVTPTTNSQGFFLQFYDNTGTLDNQSAHYGWVITQAYNAISSGGAPASYGSFSYGTSYIMLVNPAGATTNVGNTSGVRGEGTISDIRAGRPKSFDFQTSYNDDSATYYRAITGSGWRVIASPITGLRLSFTASTFGVGGAVNLWGSP
jgi:hypothetical protein